MGRFSLIVGIAVLIILLLPGAVRAAPRLQDIKGEKLVIVIDPGHGGENRGTIENSHEEKQMTMTTALAMYEELVQYEDVEVYLTHTEDIDMTLKERAAFAKSVDADFLFSIHYNASANHELFGSEVWVSAFPPYNSYGYQFGCEFLTDMREFGLLVRGVKTRLGDKGLDYYGIIRESVALDIPAVIIEHCHVDEARDAVYCENDEQLRQFGKMDAAAVARYFGLKSSSLGVDYSGYQLADADASSVVPVTVVDATEPEICRVEFLDADYENYMLKVQVTAMDSDSPLLYYSYSTDRGISYSAREVWPESDTLTGSYADTFTLEIPVTPGTWPRVIVRAYNIYDLYTESDCLTSPEAFAAPQVQEVDGRDIEVVPAEDLSLESQPEEAQKNARFAVLFRSCLLAAGILLLAILIVQGILFRRRRKNRIQRRNEPGSSRNQPR
nr:N-acetylmuramoyl-L-alanine amidase [uncultured Acetatifactor sp.]